MEMILALLAGKVQKKDMLAIIEKCALEREEREEREA